MTNYLNVWQICEFGDKVSSIYSAGLARLLQIGCIFSAKIHFVKEGLPGRHERDHLLQNAMEHCK